MLQTQASGIGEVGEYGSNGRFGGGVSMRNGKTAENGKYGIGRPGAPMVAVVENSSGGGTQAAAQMRCWRWGFNPSTGTEVQVLCARVVSGEVPELWLCTVVST
jgi:hypothetical protein